MAHSFTFNSTDVSGASYDLSVEGVDIEHLSAPMAGIAQNLDGWGGVSDITGLGPKSIVVSALIEGASAADLLANIDALRYLLNPMSGLKSLKFDDYEAGRYWMVRLNGPISGPQPGAKAHRITLPFIAPDPRAYDASQEDHDYVLAASPQTDSIEGVATAIVATAETDPVWTLTNSTGGNVSSVVLNNTTAGESITWTGTLANGEKLRFDKPRNIIEKYTGGAWANAMSGKTAGGLIPSLSPQVVNSVTTTGIATGNLNVVWRARYL